MGIRTDELVKVAFLDKEATRWNKGGKEKNKAAARYYNARRDAVMKARDEYRDIGDRHPIHSILTSTPAQSGALGLAGVLDLINARKSAYMATDPTLSLIPFTGWGKGGQKSLDAVLKEKK